MYIQFRICQENAFTVIIKKETNFFLFTLGPSEVPSSTRKENGNPISLETFCHYHKGQATLGLIIFQQKTL